MHELAAIAEGGSDVSCGHVGVSDASPPSVRDPIQDGELLMLRPHTETA